MNRQCHQQQSTHRCPIGTNRPIHQVFRARLWVINHAEGETTFIQKPHTNKYGRP